MHGAFIPKLLRALCNVILSASFSSHPFYSFSSSSTLFFPFLALLFAHPMNSFKFFLHFRNASWNRLAAESIENDVSNAHLGAHNMTSSASMTSSRTTSSSSSSRVDVVTLGRGLGGTTAARAAAHAAINSAVHQSRGAGGGGGSAAAAVGAAAAAAASIEGASSKESTAVEEPVNGAVSLLRKAKERGAARHKSSVTHRHD